MFYGLKKEWIHDPGRFHQMYMTSHTIRGRRSFYIHNEGNTKRLYVPLEEESELKHLYHPNKHTNLLQVFA